MNGSVAFVSAHGQKAAARSFLMQTCDTRFNTAALPAHVDRSSVWEAGLQQGAALGCLFHSGILKGCMDSVPKFVGLL